MTVEMPITVAPSVSRRMLRTRVFTRLRWFAVTGQLAVVFIVRFVLGFQLPLMTVLGVIGVAVVFNLYTMVRMRPARPLGSRALIGQLSFDTVQIATVLYLTGGIQNPFAVWLILPAMLAASALEFRQAIFVVAMIVLALTIVAFSHWPLPWSDPLGYKQPDIYDFGTWAALLLGVGFTSLYAFQVASEQSKLSSALDATQRVLAREERLTALGGLAAVAAHELGTPLATIQVTAREMEQELPEGTLKEDAQLLISQTQRCQRILQRLSSVGEGGDDHHNVLSIEELLRESAKPFLNEPHVAVTFAFDPECHSSPPDRLLRKSEVIYALRTLIENAVKFANHSVRIMSSWNENQLTVTIEDDGPGFPTDLLSRLGEPYPKVETQKLSMAKQGLGLGFFIATTLLERTGAQVVAGNALSLKGAYVAVTWPLANLRADPISKIGA
ncbi:ActS/PrrB/RegB family redox-sensitive histidine kinase [Parvularcula sp. LCG005]|uniref:ActS/PrrB/RegB family redox-sensitive histidine kinase n=1 Tax=Parvularcula sp. LCG005 TaxID=3078805 RepID=UPI002942A319|nr:ActS/PrrB/RegB family redox-sensitive histidine kinase [Parvularcula sp. LCG005]WOI53327.1 ActS/PrrB/RegB family redox-sensitive histidine kinase [Parvularcula sp. LCG005]